jgi:hypothetical protein
MNPMFLLARHSVVRPAHDQHKEHCRADAGPDAELELHTLDSLRAISLLFFHVRASQRFLHPSCRPQLPRSLGSRTKHPKERQSEVPAAALSDLNQDSPHLLHCSRRGWNHPPQGDHTSTEFSSAAEEGLRSRESTTASRALLSAASLLWDSKHAAAPCSATGASSASTEPRPSLSESIGRTCSIDGRKSSSRCAAGTTSAAGSTATGRETSSVLL